MKLRNLITAVALTAAVTLPATAATQNGKGIDNPMTQAVLRIYDRQLEADSTDWETWMGRAREYYIHSEYLRALNDINHALRHIPADKKAERDDALSLRANIYLQTDLLPQAITDLDAIISADPDNYVAIYQRANAKLQSENYQGASEDYRRLQRLNPRSAEALVGLARIAVKENNLGIANQLLDQAVELDPNNSEYYVRRASVRKSMGMHREAVDDLILALSTDSRSATATKALVEYGNTNYATVIAALTSAMQQAPRVGMFVYLRGVIAQAHYHYKDALADFQKIIDERLYDYNGIYASIAECQLALGRYQEALENIDHAIGMDNNKADHLIVKSQILRALDRPAEAFNIALQASVMHGGRNDAVVEMGLCRAAEGKWEEASTLFGEAQLESPEDPVIIMLRAWCLADHLNKPKAAEGFYNQVLQVEGYADTDVLSLRGFAMLKLGRETEAKAWMKNILDNVADPDGFINYMAVTFYANCNMPDEALECMRRSLEAGYANYYDWTRNASGAFTTAPLRDSLTYLSLLKRFDSLFN